MDKTTVLLFSFMIIILSSTTFLIMDNILSDTSDKPLRLDLLQICDGNYDDICISPKLTQVP